MWIFTKYGFYSAVCTRQGDGSHNQPVDVNRIVVRSRVRGHLEALKKRFPNLLSRCRIIDFVGTDYAFRIYASKSIWSQVLVGLNEEMNYDNFKTEAARHQGERGWQYEDSLHDIWWIMNVDSKNPKYI